MRSRSATTPPIALWLFALGSLALIGLIFIYASSSAFALSKHGAAHHFAIRQFWGLILTVLVTFIVAHIPFSCILSHSAVLFGGALILNLLLLIPRWSSTIHGSTRWLTISGISFQPSELLKVALLIRTTHLMSARSFTATHHFTQLIPVCITLTCTLTALLMQPDFGQSLLITLTICAQLFLAHPYLGYFRILALPLSTGVAGLVLFAPYRMRRILSFLNPWSDPQGAGFQIIQSHIAIGTGGLFGRGLGGSHQKFFYLPMQHTDFIFSIIAEETGAWGSLLVLLLYGIALWGGLAIAWRSPTPASKLFISGAVLMMALQAAINLAVATGMAPTKGIALPWISYGLSSLMSNGLLTGLVLSATRSRPESKFQI